MQGAFLFLFFASVIVAQRTSITVFTSDLQVGSLDPTTGTVVKCPFLLTLPNVTAGCEWTLGEGTRGQSSAIFYINQTYFFTAQEQCTNGIGRTLIVYTWGYYCSKFLNTYQAHTEVLQGINCHIDELNMAWDHTCNIVVIAPDKQSNGGIQLKVNQVSEYDGAQRFQPSVMVDAEWRKVPGVGALDYGSFEPSWPLGEELNCGHTCSFYSLEERISDGIAVLPRAFIGRSYRTGIVLKNITDSIQLKSLSWNPFVLWHANNNQFLGIGQCCSEVWCHSDCRDYTDGNLVLIAYQPNTGFSILADIGMENDDTIRLGVEFSTWSSSTHLAYVYYDNTVITYDLEDTNGLVTAAKRAGQSPPFTFGKLQRWAKV